MYGMLTQSLAAPYLVWHQAGKGAVARYHLDTVEINGILENLRTGTDGISLNLMLKQGAGADDVFLDWTPDGRLVGQAEANLLGVFTQLKQLQYRWIFIELEFWDQNDPRENSFTPALYDPNWFFITWLAGTLNLFGIPWMMDPCPEVNDRWKADAELGGAPNLGLQEYAKRLWVDLTGYFYPNQRPAWAFSFSFLPADLDVMDLVFQGNLPPILLPHCYSNELGSLKAALGYVRQYLSPALQGRPWIVAETDTLQVGQESIVRDLAAFVEQNTQPIIRVCPWQWSSLNPSETLVAPPIAPTVWNLAV